MNEMNQPYLQVTFRSGRPVAAYYYLPRRPGERSIHTIELSPGILVDFNSADHPVGVEIPDPRAVSLGQLNRVLLQLGLSTLTKAEFAPLRAA